MVMLFPCLVLGCSVSSFAYRRQGRDHLQAIVFTLFILGALIVGFATKASPNLILLAYLPWAVCMAMAASYSGHRLVTRLRMRAAERSEDSEKNELLG